jgi:formylmethanofuran dehydrogenase subunit E
MMRWLLCCGVLAVAGVLRAEEQALPEPYYLSVPEDPAWLKTTVQFHGHLGPWVVIGARFGMAGLKAVEAHGFFDVEIRCEGPFPKPPQSCFLDGLQIGSGATLGKRTLNYVEAEKIVLYVKNTRTGQTVELRPTPKLLEMVGTLQAKIAANAAREENHAHGGRAPVAAEGAARKIARWPDSDLVVVTAGAGAAARK